MQSAVFLLYDCLRKTLQYFTKILPTTGVPGLLVHADSMGYVMEKEGWTYSTKDANGQPSAQVDFVNDTIAAGNVGALMIASSMDDDAEATIEAAGGALNTLGEEDAARVQEAFFSTGVADSRMYAQNAGTSEEMEVVLKAVADYVGLELPE